jgi:hypothetical protein
MNSIPVIPSAARDPYVIPSAARDPYSRTDLQAAARSEVEAKVGKTALSPLQFFLPSVRDIIFIFLFWSVLAGTLSNRPFADPDIGWHIRTGELMLASHALPRTDPFSSTMHGQTWFAWEWLYDLTLGILHRAAGLNGVAWLCALIVATTFTCLLSQLLKWETGLLLAIFLMLVAEAASMIHLLARPHIVSWLFMLAWFAALERWEQGNAPRWLPSFFPLSMLFWVNLHGGWPVGLLLLAIYLIAARIESMRAADPFAALRTLQRARSISFAGALSLLATFVNPFGWHLHTHIYRYLGDRYLMNRIAEFRSPNFHEWAPRCFVIILLLTLLALASHRGRVRLSHLMVVLLAVYAGLIASRNLPVSSMLLVLVSGPMLWQEVASLAAQPRAWKWLRAGARRTVDFSARMGTQELRLRGHLWPVMSVVAGLAICLHGGWLGSRHLVNVHFDSTKIPAAAVDFLEQQPSHESVLSTDTWGGYLIYRLYPSRQVVIDDRHDLFGSDRVRELLIFLQGEPGWQDVLENWHVQTVLLPSESTAANLLHELPRDWRLAYQDDVAVVFERR